MNKAYKFRIYPTKDQIKYFEESVRTNRFIYNTFLRKQMDVLEEANEKFGGDKKSRNEYMTKNSLWFNKFEVSRELTQMGKKEEYSFLMNIDATSKSYVLKNLDSAFKGIKSGGGFPKFKNRLSSFCFTGQIQNSETKPKSMKLFDVKDKICTLNLPKCKNIKMVCHIPFFIENWSNINVIKFNSYTISRKGKDKYFVSFQVEVEDIKFKQKEIKKETSLGIDFGVKRPITTSDMCDFNSTVYGNQFNLLKKYSLELKKLSSILNRKRDFHKKNKSEIKFSETASFKRISKKLSNTHVKISNIRENLQHNITSNLVNNENYDTFIIEDLKIKNMTKKSGKGLSNKKSNLNRVMLDSGLGTIKTQLEYKSKNIGKNLVLVDPKYTSQTCSLCGHVSKLNRQKQDSFKCVSCGHEANADFNAAVNIKNKYFIQNP